MNIETLERVFQYAKGNTTLDLSDPDPNSTPQEVLKIYAATYPELNNGSVSEGTTKDDKLVFKFSTTIGTKG